LDSRQRKAVYYPKAGRVAIEPLDKSKKADTLRHYNAMMFNDYGLLVVSNGLHTEDIFNSPDRSTEALRKMLNKWGPEPDNYHTPRIAGVVDYPQYCLAIITENKNARSIRVRPKLGMAHGISTYSGQGIVPEPFDVNRFTHHTLPNVRIEGTTPEDIAKFFANKVIDPEFFVCCASALWYEDDEKWKIATLNGNG